MTRFGPVPILVEKGMAYLPEYHWRHLTGIFGRSRTGGIRHAGQYHCGIWKTKEAFCEIWPALCILNHFEI